MWKEIYIDWKKIEVDNVNWLETAIMTEWLCDWLMIVSKDWNKKTTVSNDRIYFK